MLRRNNLSDGISKRRALFERPSADSLEGRLTARRAIDDVEDLRFVCMGGSKGPLPPPFKDRDCMTSQCFMMKFPLPDEFEFERQKRRRWKMAGGTLV